MKTIKVYYYPDRYGTRPAEDWKVLPVADSVAEVLEGRYETAEDLYNASEFLTTVTFAIERLLQLERGTDEYINVCIDRIEIVQEGTV